MVGPVPATGQESSAVEAEREPPVAVLANQLRTIAHELRSESDDFALATMAHELLRCIAGPELNLDGLEPTLKRFVAAMPQEAWHALQDHAVAAAGVGITSVRLDAKLLSARVVDGLKVLSALERVFVAAPAKGTCIDFTDLRCPDQPEGRMLPKIVLEGDAPRGLWFKVPLGATVEAQGQSGPGLWKSLVFSTNPDGHLIGRAHPLHGQIHAGAATEFRLPGVFSKDDPQARAHAIHLNLTAWMSDDELAVCRQLSAQWLNDLLGDAPLSYKQHYASEAGISAHVHASVNADLERMMAQGSCAIYKPERFGAMLTDQFAGMQVGEKRLFAVSTGHHMFGLQLLVDETSHGGVTRREHLVKLYDPTHTAKHEEVTLTGDDLSLLSSKGLVDFCGDAENVRDYFAGDKYLFGSLFPWPPGPARQPGAAVQVSVHVSPEDMASGAFLYTALEDGHVALVRQSLLAFRAQGLGMDERELAAIAGDPSIPGLHRAVSTGSPPEVVEEYLRQILDITPRVLSSAAKLSLCQADHRYKTALGCALELGRSDMVLSILRPVMAAPDALSRGDRYKLLLSPSSSGQPMLSKLCAAAPSSPFDAERAFRCEAMHDYLKEIVKSSVLSDAEKESLVSAHGGPPGGGQFAARLALNSGNPGEAAAMLLAVLESDVPPALRARLLTALGVTADEVLAGFSGTVFDKGAEEWMVNTIQRIKAHASPGS